MHFWSFPWRLERNGCLCWLDSYHLYGSMHETTYETRLYMRLCTVFILFHVSNYIYHLFVLAYDGL
jgi:hypothetical protein